MRARPDGATCRPVKHAVRQARRRTRTAVLPWAGRVAVRAALSPGSAPRAVRPVPRRPPAPPVRSAARPPQPTPAPRRPPAANLFVIDRGVRPHAPVDGPHAASWERLLALAVGHSGFGAPRQHIRILRSHKIVNGTLGG